MPHDPDPALDGKSGPIVKYALASTSAPVAVADYQGLPAETRRVLRRRPSSKPSSKMSPPPT